MLKALWLCVTVYLCLAAPAQGAGIELLDSDPTLAGAVWYPCAGGPQDVPLGKLSVQIVDTLAGVKDCALPPGKLPLVVLSHGRGGWFGGHSDVAEALADAGFIVAAINHPGDNGNDSSGRDSLAVLASRPRDITRLIDFMLRNWSGREAIDPGKIGFFGFSAGAYTGLVLIGGVPDFRRIEPYCQPSNTSRGCEEFRSGRIPPSPPHDSRIKAAALADTAVNFAFTPEGLADIHAPLLIWRSKHGGGGVDPKNSALTASYLPDKPEVHTVPAGHFAFLPPCSPQFAEALPRFCTDPPGFDRSAFHRELNASIAGFFRKHLAGNETAR